MAEQHRMTRSVDASVEHVVAMDRHGHVDEDYHITAIDGGGEWGCSCGEGPFPDKDAAISHLKTIMGGD